MRIGHGYDVHKLVDGRKCIIGGVDIPCNLGLLGHSDADVLLHAISDAILGAAAMGDIGHLFPDTDDKWKGADSLKLTLPSILHRGTTDRSLFESQSGLASQELHFVLRSSFLRFSLLLQDAFCFSPLTFHPCFSNLSLLFLGTRIPYTHTMPQ